MSANILQWRPKNTTAAPGVPAPRLLWTVHKQRWRIECILEGGVADGWNVRVLLNGQWFFCCRFTSWPEAIQAATDKYTELAAAGWQSPTRTGANG